MIETITLAQWQAANPLVWVDDVPYGPVGYDDRPIVPYVSSTDPSLWNLSDYAVSTVSGYGVYLVPRHSAAMIEATVNGFLRDLKAGAA